MVNHYFTGTERQVVTNTNYVGKFSGNSHIVQPARTDFNITHTDVKATFPRPLPAYLPRTSPAPSGVGFERAEPGNINSAYAGRFTMGLRGVRRELRQRGGIRARHLVQDVEEAIQAWLDGVDTSQPNERTGRAVDRSEPPSIVEVSHGPLEMIWRTDDPFARWIVHCVSRWHGVVSFSEFSRK